MKNFLFQFLFLLIFIFKFTCSAQGISNKDSLAIPNFYQSVNVIDGEFVDSSIDMTLDGPIPIELKRWSAPPKVLGNTIARGWAILPLDLFSNTKDEKPKESQFSSHKFVYEYDQKGKLKGLQTQSLDGKETYNGFTVISDTKKQLVLETWSGKKLSYEFKEDLDGTKLLTKVNIQGKPEISYSYENNPFDKRKMISSRQESPGKKLQIEYYWIDTFATGRVKTLKAPDANGKIATIARFVYRDGETEVYDALNHKTIYKYSKDKLLTAIESQNPDGKSTGNYRTHRFYWDNGKLISKTLEDGNKHVLQCETFQYDSKGRLTKQTLWGNLSGLREDAFAVDDKGQPRGFVESYSKNYQLLDGEEDLVTSISEDNGTVVKFTYNEKTRALESQLTHHQGKIVKREFYQYDGQGNLIRTILDDGKSPSYQDLSGVTERRITEILAYASSPNSSLPQIVEERYLDLQTGSEKILKKMVNTYSNEGQLLTQQAYDSDGILRQSLENTYDSKGNLASKKDLEGKNTTYSYDIYGNPTRRTSFDDKIDTQFYYDNNNQIIREDELSTDGSLRSVNYRYDVLGNKISSSDSCGNVTEYSYDALNRLSSTIFPPVEDPFGNVVRYQSSNQYDLQDRITRTENPDGRITETRFNVRGKPIQVRHPDGTLEKWTYNLDGTVLEQTDRKGMTTHYTYDGLGNPVETVLRAENGAVIQTVKSKYSSFRLLSSQDSSGKNVKYTYDGAGRLIKEVSGTSRIEYEYDALGQGKVKKEWYGTGENDYRSTVTERDPDNNIKRVYIQDSAGNILIVRESEDEDSKANEIESRVSNKLGQIVVKTTTLDKEGVATELTYDAMNRIASMVKKDRFGRVLSTVEYRYDFNGNTCKEIHTIVAPDSQERKFIIGKQWNLNNQLLQITEGENSTQQKITHYSYNSKGQIEQIIKPDGKSILQEYNPLGQLTVLRASDNSFAYRYQYDSTGNIVLAEDLVQHTVTRRSYDEKHQLTSENLGNGLYSTWSYDPLGRLIATTLPDQTSTCYKYDAANLREVQRNLKNKTLVHSYTYDNERGRVLEAQLMGNCGKLTFNYDYNGKPQSLETPHFGHTIGDEARDSMGRILSAKIRDPKGVVKSGYTYDPLGRLLETREEKNTKYTYDSLDNRLSIDGQKLALNHLNQLLSTPEAQYSYDDNGNLISEKRLGQLERKYTYDPLNRLIKVTIGNDIYQYTYDPFNRRISKKHQNEVENYLYYGDLEIGSADKNGAIKQLRTLGIGIGAEAGAAVFIEIEGQEYVPIHDLQGSVRALVDVETNKVAEFYRYAAFGEVTIFDSYGNELEYSEIGNPWFFSGKRLDTESGLYFFGKRYYSAELGRWFTPDPLGFADGANLYSYVHQNPLNANDLYGLFSFSDLLNAIKAFFIKCFEKIKAFFETVATWFKTYLSASAIRDYFKFIGYEIIAKGYAILRGKFNYQSVQGVYGEGEINDKVRVTFINGIYTKPSHLVDNIKGISESHGGVNVHYVYSASRGIILDLIRAARIKFGFTSPEAHILADTWRQMIAEMGGTEGGGKIIHYAHSIGAGDTERALRLMTLEERKMIDISTFGSPILMDGEYRGSHVTNYVNVRDGVSLLDPLKYFKALFSGDRSIIFVGAMNGFPFIDHLFGCPAYRHVYETLGKYFVQFYGG